MKPYWKNRALCLGMLGIIGLILVGEHSFVHTKERQVFFQDLKSSHVLSDSDTERETGHTRTNSDAEQEETNETKDEESLEATESETLEENREILESSEAETKENEEIEEGSEFETKETDEQLEDTENKEETEEIKETEESQKEETKEQEETKGENESVSKETEAMEDEISDTASETISSQIVVPTITVHYDNNNVQNGFYFKSPRTITVSILDSNFDISRVHFYQTGVLDGIDIPVPQAAWSNEGDMYIATFVYDRDGDYTFDIEITDIFGNVIEGINYGDAVARHRFIIAQSVEKPVIMGVEDGKSYKFEVKPQIEIKDINSAIEEILLTRTGKEEINQDITTAFAQAILDSSLEDRDNVIAWIPENDGIYTLTVKVKDKAGNEETERVSFTVNRFGSIYTFGDYLKSLQDSYVQKLTQDLIIIEYNPDQLLEDSLNIEISRDSTPLKNIIYTVTEIPNEKLGKAWYQYEYVIDAANFVQDGIYQISIASKDEAGNESETMNYEEGMITFRVDTTPPEITNIIGLENSLVKAKSQKVEFELFDAIGLKQMTVYINDVPVKTYSQFENLSDFYGSMTLQKGTKQKIRLVVEDLAGNILDTDTVDEAGNYEFMPAFAFEREVTVGANSSVAKWIAAGSLLGMLAVIYFLNQKKKK